MDKELNQNNIKIIFNFTINETGRNYIVYTLDNEEESEETLIYFARVEKENNKTKIYEIKSEEEEQDVINAYNNIKRHL